MRANRSRIGARVRLGDRHRNPALSEASLLFIGADGAQRGVSESLARDGEREADVAPAEFHHPEDRGEVAAVAVPGRPVTGLVRGGVSPQLAGRSARTAVVHPVEDRGEHVEFLRVCVLGQVVLTGDGPKDARRDGMGLLDERAQPLGNLEIDHGVFLLGMVMREGPLRAPQSRASLCTSAPRDAL